MKNNSAALRRIDQALAGLDDASAELGAEAAKTERVLWPDPPAAPAGVSNADAEFWGSVCGDPSVAAEVGRD